MRAHRNAVIAFLEQSLSGAVFKPSGVPAPAPARYAVVYVARSAKPRTRLTGGQWQDIFTVTVHSVGVDEDSALWVEGHVNGLTGASLTVSGRKVWPAEYVTGVAAGLDDSAPVPLYFAVSQFDIYSNPS